MEKSQLFCQCLNWTIPFTSATPVNAVESEELLDEIEKFLTITINQENVPFLENYTTSDNSIQDYMKSWCLIGTDVEKIMIEHPCLCIENSKYSKKLRATLRANKCLICKVVVCVVLDDNKVYVNANSLMVNCQELKNSKEYSPVFRVRLINEYKNSSPTNLDPVLESIISNAVNRYIFREYKNMIRRISLVNVSEQHRFNMLKNKSNEEKMKFLEIMKSINYSNQIQKCIRNNSSVNVKNKNPGEKSAGKLACNPQKMCFLRIGQDFKHSNHLNTFDDQAYMETLNSGSIGSKISKSTIKRNFNPSLKKLDDTYINGQSHEKFLFDQSQNRSNIKRHHPKKRSKQKSKSLFDSSNNRNTNKRSAYHSVSSKQCIEENLKFFNVRRPNNDFVYNNVIDKHTHNQNIVDSKDKIIPQVFSSQDFSRMNPNNQQSDNNNVKNNIRMPYKTYNPANSKINKDDPNLILNKNDLNHINQHTTNGINKYAFNNIQNDDKLNKFEFEHVNKQFENIEFPNSYETFSISSEIFSSSSSDYSYEFYGTTIEENEINNSKINKNSFNNINQNLIPEEHGINHFESNSNMDRRINCNFTNYDDIDEKSIYFQPHNSYNDISNNNFVSERNLDNISNNNFISEQNLVNISNNNLTSEYNLDNLDNSRKNYLSPINYVNAENYSNFNRNSCNYYNRNFDTKNLEKKRNLNYENVNSVTIIAEIDHNDNKDLKDETKQLKNSNLLDISFENTNNTLLNTEYKENIDGNDFIKNRKVIYDESSNSCSNKILKHNQNKISLLHCNDSNDNYNNLNNINYSCNDLNNSNDNYSNLNIINDNNTDLNNQTHTDFSHNNKYTNQNSKYEIDTQNNSDSLYNNFDAAVVNNQHSQFCEPQHTDDTSSNITYYNECKNNSNHLSLDKQKITSNNHYPNYNINEITNNNQSYKSNNISDQEINNIERYLNKNTSPTKNNFVSEFNGPAQHLRESHINELKELKKLRKNKFNSAFTKDIK